MDANLRKKLTPEILAGAESLGVAGSLLLTILRAKPGQLAAFRCGSRGVSAAQARALEEETGRTVGEMAVLGIARQAPSRRRTRDARLVQETCALMAEFDRIDSGQSPKRTVAARGRNGHKKRSVA